MVILKKVNIKFIIVFLFILNILKNKKKLVKNVKLCFFGDKNRILIFDVLKNEWNMVTLDVRYFKINYYASAVTIPSGDILILGGGISN